MSTVHTLTPRQSAATTAASRLMRSGLDCACDLKSREAIDWPAHTSLEASYSTL
jgi:hypothetical protein